PRSHFGVDGRVSRKRDLPFAGRERYRTHEIGRPTDDAIAGLPRAQTFECVIDLRHFDIGKVSVIAAMECRALNSSMSSIAWDFRQATPKPTLSRRLRTSYCSSRHKTGFRRLVL